MHTSVLNMFHRVVLLVLVCWSVLHVIIRFTIESHDEERSGNVNFSQMIIVNVFHFDVMVDLSAMFQPMISMFCFGLFLGEANVRVGTSFDNKTDQWLGASIAANDGNVIVSLNIESRCQVAFHCTNT